MCMVFTGEAPQKPVRAEARVRAEAPPRTPRTLATMPPLTPDEIAAITPEHLACLRPLQRQVLTARFLADKPGGNPRWPRNWAWIVAR
jgi:hypothetical protein